MKRIFLLLTAFIAAVGTLIADIHITSEPDFIGSELKISAVPLEDVMTKGRRDLMPMVFSTTIKDGTSLSTPGNGPQRYTVKINSYVVKEYYAMPADSVEMYIDEDGYVTVTGTPLLNEIADLEDLICFTQYDYETALNASEEASAAKAWKVLNNQLALYVSSNPDSPAAAWAVLQMDQSQQLKYAAMLRGEATTCLIYPLVDAIVSRAKDREHSSLGLAQKRLPAPSFALADAYGKTVALSKFRGRWVMLDFWGTWCPSCMKEFASMKNIYREYKGKLEIIGISCNDSKSNWLTVLKRLELPWVNVYNPRGSQAIIRDYNVKAFPTKVLIDPEGNMVKIIVGEDASLSNQLKQLIQ